MIIAESRRPNLTTDAGSINYNNINYLSDLNIYDLKGRLIYNNIIVDVNGELNIDTTTYPNGIYIVVLKTNNEIILQQKLLKQ